MHILHFLHLAVISSGSTGDAGRQSSICPLRPASAEAGFPLGEPTVLCGRRMKVP